MGEILEERPLEISARPPDSGRRKHSRHPPTKVYHGASIAPSCGPAQALSSHSMVPPTPVACRTRIATTVSMDLDTSEPAAPRRPGLRARAVVRAASPPTGGPAFVPFQLSDEQYASVYRDPDANGYPTLVPGAVRAPKFGYIYVEQRSPGGRRPKLVDGLDWVPSSSANASYKMLKDGRSEIVRFYCSRRTKGEHARPQQKPYNVFAAERQEEVKAANPELNSYDVKKVLGQQWREMGAAAKRPYQEQSQHENRQLRQRMSAADPQQLLVRHEIWIQPQGLTRSKEAAPERVIVHYLGSQTRRAAHAAHATARARFPPFTSPPPCAQATPPSSASRCRRGRCRSRSPRRRRRARSPPRSSAAAATPTRPSASRSTTTTTTTAPPPPTAPRRSRRCTRRRTCRSSSAAS